MEEKKKVKIGLGTFDLIKGIAILCVILGHAYENHPLEVASFSGVLGDVLGSLLWGLMPMFFIVSGYGFKKKPAMKMLKKTFSELVVPYLVAIPVAILLHLVLCWKLYPSMAQCLENTEKQILGFLLGTSSAGPLWFFLAMFIANNLLNLILKVKKESTQFLLVGLCVAAGFIVMQLYSVMGFDRRSFRIVEGLTAVGFCYTGYFLKEKKIFGRAMYSVWTYIILVPMWMLQFWGMANGGAGFDMARADFTFSAYLLAGATGLLLIFTGLMLNQLEWDWLDLVRKCGMQSYWILIVHTIDYLAFPWYDLWRESRSICLAFLIELALRILIITMGCEIIKKITQARYKIKMDRLERI